MDVIGFTYQVIDEFMWRHNFKISRENAFKEIMKAISTVYDPYILNKVTELEYIEPVVHIEESYDKDDVDDRLIDQQVEYFDLNEANYDKILSVKDYNQDIDRLCIPIICNIFSDSDTEQDMLVKFEKIKNEYFNENNFNRLIFKNLTSAKRRQLHILSEESNLYHSTNSNNKDFNLSNKIDDKISHLKAQERHKSKEDPLANKLEQLNSRLERMEIRNVQRTAIELEKESLEMPISSDEANKRMADLQIVE